MNIEIELAKGKDKTCILFYETGKGGMVIYNQIYFDKTETALLFNKVIELKNKGLLNGF